MNENEISGKALSHAVMGEITVGEAILDGIKFRIKADRQHLVQRITKAIQQATAVSRIYADNRNDQRLKDLESHYQAQVARLEADLREAYAREANHLIDRAREGNRVVTRGSVAEVASTPAWRHEHAAAGLKVEIAGAE